jgi:GT2 family glycosyltransferase
VREVGLLAEEYFLYYEEPDWAERGRRMGNWELGYAWKARVYHKEGASTGGGTHRRKTVSQLSDFYFVRSRILFTRKFQPYCLPTVYAGLLIAIANRLWHGQPDRALMIVKTMLSPRRTFKSTT